ncbi:MAG: hypothetical protein R3E35_09110 [Rhodocyclaceae bacterium]
MQGTLMRYPVAIEGFEALPAKDRGLRLPALGDVSHRCGAFTQKIGHAVTLEDVACLFYPGEINNKWVDSLVTEEHLTAHARDQFAMVEHHKIL